LAKNLSKIFGSSGHFAYIPFRPQADFEIYHAVFSALQNGKKIYGKNWYPSIETGLALPEKLAVFVDFSIIPTFVSCFHTHNRIGWRNEHDI
jgi:hypothetical protein